MVVKQRSLDLQESCRDKRQKVPDNVAEAAGLADEFDKQGGVQFAQVTKKDPSAVLPSKDPEVTSLLGSLKKPAKKRLPQWMS